MMKNLASGFVSVAGTRLYYEEAGIGPALVFVHGFSGNLHMWDEQFSTLADRFRVIRYDLRGHGQSDLPGEQPYAHADDLDALLAFLSVERAVVVGISMGGWIATHFTLTYPQRVAGTVLISSALIGWEWTPEWKVLWSALTERARSQGVAAAKQLWLEHPLFSMVRNNPATAGHLQRMVEAYSGWHWLHHDPQRAIDIPDMEQLDRIATPVLIVSGDEDFPDFRLIAEILAHNIPRVETLALPGVGHLANLEAPQALNAAISAFADTVYKDR